MLVKQKFHRFGWGKKGGERGFYVIRKEKRNLQFSKNYPVLIFVTNIGINRFDMLFLSKIFTLIDTFNILAGFSSFFPVPSPEEHVRFRRI